jgi:16S rRNA (guanine1207-N2)-methyltransferase
MADDPALDTLLYPFSSGLISWPPDGRILFLRARSGPACAKLPRKQLVCEQSFKPFADALSRDGFHISEAKDETFPLVLALLPRQREEARALLARAVQRVAANGLVMASMSNTEGARSGEADLERLAGNIQSSSKNKCRVFWATVSRENINTSLLEEWLALDAPRPIADGRFLSRPGLFAWDRIDSASALLAAHFPDNLSGRAADLGAGYGYLSVELLARNPRITALDSYEAEARAVSVARLNLAEASKRIETNFHWHDVTTGLLDRYDVVVSNPPFHQGRADQPDLGKAFIAAAARALNPGGRFWLVANRHLPYESVLASHFAAVRPVAVKDGFKVIESVKAQS